MTQSTTQNINEEPNGAERALGGREEYIELGEWTLEEEEKIVAFKGVQPSSSCYVIGSNGSPRAGASAHGRETKEILVFKKEKVYAINAHIVFKPVIIAGTD